VDDASLRAAIALSVPELTEGQIGQLVAFRDVMHETNTRINLTAVRDRGDMGRRLILESLRLVAPVREGIGRDPLPRLMDLGTGGGIPGAIIAIAFPEVPVTLMDATGKKLAAVKTMLDAIGVANATTLHGRAEDLAHLPEWRDRFTVVTARAVSSLPALAELGLPFLKRQGTLVLPKGPNIADELTAARGACATLGGRVAMVSVLPDNGSQIETTLVTITKTRDTPAAYPRRSGLPSRSPLGVPS
jgi:16S rRNA (guanine527-N7)-methyltransferase